MIYFEHLVCLFVFLFPHGQSYVDYSFITVMKKHYIVRKFAKITTDAKDMHP
jgi:hypothetical protein